MSVYEPKTVYWSGGHIPTVDNILTRLGYTIDLQQFWSTSVEPMWVYDVSGPKGKHRFKAVEGELLTRVYGLILQWVLE